MDKKTYDFTKKAARTAYQEAINDAVGGGGQPLPDTEQHRHPDYSLVDHGHEEIEHTHDEFADKEHDHDNLYQPKGNYALASHTHEGGGSEGGGGGGGISAFMYGNEPVMWYISQWNSTRPDMSHSNGLMTNWKNSTERFSMGKTNFGIAFIPTALPDGSSIPTYSSNTATFKIPSSSMRQATEAGLKTINDNWNGDYYAQVSPPEIQGRGMTCTIAYTSTLHPGFYVTQCEKSGSLYSFVGYFPWDIELEQMFQ